MLGGVIIYSPREAKWVIGVAEGKERTLVSEGSMQREGEDNQGQEVARRLAGTMFTLSIPCGWRVQLICLEGKQETFPFKSCSW